MIKKLKNFICKIFGIKQCACAEDEHMEFYTKVPEPEVPMHEEKPKHCLSHLRFRKSCQACQEIVA